MGLEPRWLCQNRGFSSPEWFCRHPGDSSLELSLVDPLALDKVVLVTIRTMLSAGGDELLNGFGSQTKREALGHRNGQKSRRHGDGAHLMMTRATTSSLQGHPFLSWLTVFYGRRTQALL